MKLLLIMGLLMPLASAEIFFQDQFSDGDKWESRWTYSKHHSADKLGKFVLSSGDFYGDVEKDKGLKTSEDARFYALSAKLDKPVSTTGEKPLIVQYTVKHEQDIDCGGGYVKLFGADLNAEDMHGESEYDIMFGPDICGPSNKKVHAIFNFNGKNHLINKEIRCKDDVMTNLYTMILDPKEKVLKVKINNEEVHSAPIEESHDILPARKIKDPEAKKPADWDDKKMIDDPEDKKPEDFDKPEHIPDPDATKPDDWDDEMDGEWEPSMIDNPEYKGEWKPKQIENPNYSGEWVHPMIDNPDFNEDDVKKIGSYSDISYIGIDIWQVKSGTIFDNFLVTDDIELAEKQAEELWKVTADSEKAMKEKLDKEKADAEKEAADNKADTEEEEEEEEDEEEEEQGSEDVIESEDDGDHDEL